MTTFGCMLARAAWCSAWRAKDDIWLQVGAGRLVLCLACLVLLRLCESWIFPSNSNLTPAYGEANFAPVFDN